MYTVRRADQKNIKAVKDNIRPETLEMSGLTESEFRKAIQKSVKKSTEVFAWIKDGKTHAIGGYSFNDETLRTAIWCVTTPLTDGHAEDVIEAGKQFVDSFRGHRLHALIDPRDARVVKLVQLIGLTPSVHLNPARQFFVKE